MVTSCDVICSRWSKNKINMRVLTYLGEKAAKCLIMSYSTWQASGISAVFWQFLILVKIQDSGHRPKNAAKIGTILDNVTGPQQSHKP